MPKSLAGEIKELALNGDDAFAIDPAIPLPVEIDDDENKNIKNLLEELSWEMILSGMIQVIKTEKNSSGDITQIEGVKPHWIDYYRRFILILKPEILGEFLNAALVKAGNRDFGAALEIFSALESLFPFSPVVLLNKALIQEEEAAELDRKGCEMEAALENDRALETYLKALEMQPLLPDIFFSLGAFYAKRKDFGKACECFSDYIQQADDPDKKTEAENIINEITKAGLDDFKYLKSLELIRQGKEEEALLLIRDFIEEYPEVWNGLYNLGWALRKLGRWNDAMVSLKKALELGGAAADTRNETAICMMELGDYAGARKELEAALRKEPDNVKIISNLGMLAMKKGDQDEAAGFFRTVLDLNPEDPLAKKFFSKPGK